MLLPIQSLLNLLTACIRHLLIQHAYQLRIGNDDHRAILQIIILIIEYGFPLTGLDPDKLVNVIMGLQADILIRRE
jgi:hypothetical protein